MPRGTDWRTFDALERAESHVGAAVTDVLEIAEIIIPASDEAGEVRELARALNEGLRQLRFAAHDRVVRERGYRT